jgi:hypothetical protein
MAKNNVMARLYNSNPVKEAMADILKAVQASLGLEDIRNNGGQRVQKAQKDGKAQSSSLGRMALNGSLVDGDANTTVEPGFRDKDPPSSDKATDGFIPEDEQDRPSLRKYDNRIAETKDEEDDFGCDGGVGEGMVRGSDEVSLRAYNPGADLSLSPPSSESSSSSPRPFNSRKRKKSLTDPKSTFLPSLMGGYWSGSESGEEGQSADLQPRKNRMGQRARRQLWEKKFGTKANHLRGVVRDNDWDPKRGAKAVDNRGGRPRDGFRCIDVATKYSKTGDKPGERRSSDRSRSLVKVNEGPLHPSWEAAKKAKKQATFQGKKIVFD